ncbi:hypothetical protein [Actinoplanes solisilvae]|uniref:hypothetical protein n=1 Tax=Actinoplanes solisilvae TaxID=2486853 RepID=UPI000FDB2710|nr:hypothetical protein [Actinoplanes solisilvae]
MNRYVGLMQTGGARGAISVPSLSAMLAALAAAPLWTSFFAALVPALAAVLTTAAVRTSSTVFAAVLIALAAVALATAALAIAAIGARVPARPPVAARSSAEPPGDTTRLLLTRFAAGVSGSRAPPLASA